MDKEMNLVISLLNNPHKVTYGQIAAIKGKIGNNNVTVAKCGIGKVNAAIRTLTLIKEENPDLIINTGVAGGAGLPIGTILIADKVAFDDVWCGPGTKYGEADGCPLYFTPSQMVIDVSKESQNEFPLCYGLICTGDKFISSAEEIAFIRNHFPDVKAVDMESAAIAQTCFLNSIPFNIIRVVSDTPGEGENILQYKNFWEDAPKKTFEVVRNIITKIGKENME